MDGFYLWLNNTESLSKIIWYTLQYNFYHWFIVSSWTTQLVSMITYSVSKNNWNITT